MNQRTTSPAFALFQAIHLKDHAELSRLLKDEKVDPNSVLHENTALVQALLLENLEGARLLLEAKADPNLEAPSGSVPISCAAFYKTTEQLQLLFAHKADIHTVERFADQSPLDIAADNNREKNVELLIQLKADVSRQNVRANSPLLDAAKNNSLAIVRLLLAAKADTETCNEMGDTALGYAKEHQNAELIKILTERETKLSQQPVSLKSKRNFDYKAAAKSFGELLKSGEILADFPSTELWMLMTDGCQLQYGQNNFRARYYEEMNRGFQFIITLRKEEKVTAEMLQKIYETVFQYQKTNGEGKVVMSVPALGFRTSEASTTNQGLFLETQKDFKNEDASISIKGLPEFVDALMETAQSRKTNPLQSNWKLHDKENKEVIPRSDSQKTLAALSKLSAKSNMTVKIQPAMVDRKAVVTFVQQSLNVFYREVECIKAIVGQPIDRERRIITAIVKLSRKLNQHHVFIDGNGRVLIMLMQNLLLMQLLNKMAIIIYPTHYIGFSAEELTIEIQRGIFWVDACKITPLKKVISQLNVDTLQQLEKSKIEAKLKTALSPNSKIASIQINELYKRILNGSLRLDNNSQSDAKRVEIGHRRLLTILEGLYVEKVLSGFMNPPIVYTEEEKKDETARASKQRSLKELFWENSEDYSIINSTMRMEIDRKLDDILNRDCHLFTKMNTPARKVT